MKMIKMWKYGVALLSMLGLLASLAVPAQAATGYEVTNVGFYPAVTADQYVSLNTLNQDLTVSWTAPTDATLVMSYLLKISTSNAPLTDQQFGDDASTYDYKVQSVPGLTNYYNNYPQSFFNTWDVGQVHYLHIKTQYVPSSYSDDVVVGQIKIDNVAPSGQLTLNPTSGSSTQINVSFSPSEQDINYYWLSTASTLTSETRYTYSSLNGAAAPFSLPTGTAYGSVNINAWFEDLAGNRSTVASATKVYTYSAPVSIVYNSSTINVGDSLGFTVGTTPYNWTINVTSGTGVATFSGISTGVASVNVVGAAPGTFTLTAKLSDTDPNPLTTGSVTVVQTATTVDIPLSVGWNLISIPNQPSDTSITTILNGISDKYSIVWGEFNPATSAWKSYNPSKPSNTLTAIAPNKGYWINATTACTLSVTGSAASKGTNLVTGWNLIGFSGTTDTSIATVLSGISESYSIVWGEFNPSTSAWKSYNPSKPSNTLSTLGAGKGYWINATQDSTLSY